MLYHLLYPFHTEIAVLNVVQYITFRTAAASISAFAISLLLGGPMIRKLREFQIGPGPLAQRGRPDALVRRLRFPCSQGRPRDWAGWCQL